MIEMLSIYEYCILLKSLRKGGGEDKGRGGLKSCINLITYINTQHIDCHCIMQLSTATEFFFIL